MTYRLPLFDHRVLDLAEGYSGYLGRILGDMGAEVIKIEPPPGDSLRGGPSFDACNANKYSCTLDLHRHRVIVLRLALLADVVITSPASIDPATFRTENDGLIVVELPAEAGPVSCAAAAGAIGLALWDRRRTGKGGIVRVAALAKGDLAAEAAPPTESVLALEGMRDVPACPIHLSETPLHIRLPPPSLGEHNDYVFRHLLGLSSTEIAALA